MCECVVKDVRGVRDKRRRDVMMGEGVAMNKSGRRVK